MRHDCRLDRSGWFSALPRISLCLALAAIACDSSTTTPGGSGGTGGSGNGGASSSGGSGTGGSGSGGVSSSGGSGSGGATRSGSGGSSVNGGAIGSGGSSVTGGSGSGGSVTGGAIGSGGSLVTGGATGTGGRSGRGGAGGAGTTGIGSGGTGTGGSGTGIGTGGATGTGGSTSSGTPVPSAGCGKTSTLTFATVPGESGTNVGTGKGGYVTIQSGGQSRGFAMRLPDNYDNTKPYWLVFGFHWNGGTSKDVDTGGSNGYSMAHFGLQALSKNGAIFVAPQGNNNGWGGNNLPFLDDMVKVITDNYCVDTTRLYANGFSYGGGMSYAIACARAKVFRAVAIYNGAVLSGCEGGNDPIAYWQMAGTTDNTCSIGMATPMRDRFAKNNGCTIPAAEPPRPTSISQPHICTNYTGCSSGHPLRWCVHPAGHGNAIVDGTGDLYNACATPPKTCSDTCKCTWVPQDVWSFFTSL